MFGRLPVADEVTIPSQHTFRIGNMRYRSRAALQRA